MTIVQFTNSYLFLAISIFCGVGLLQGYRWVRSLFVIYGFIHYIIVFTSCPIQFLLNARTIIPIVVFLGISFVLFRPEKDRYTDQVTDQDPIPRNGIKWNESRILGVCVSLFPLFYALLLILNGSSLPFDILTFKLQRVLFEGLPFIHVLIIWACAIPLTIFFYRRLESKNKSIIYLCIINVVVSVTYFIAFCLITIVFFILGFQIFGAM